MLPHQQPQQHVFSHQHHQYTHEPSWVHQQAAAHHHNQQPQQTQHPNHISHHQQHAQAQAAAALSAVATQAHYGRAAANSTGSSNANGYNQGHGAHSLGTDLGGTGSLDGNFTDEHKRLVGWVAELLNGNSREQALMELSKKREQVPELALIIWYSFGTSTRTLP